MRHTYTKADSDDVVVRFDELTAAGAGYAYAHSMLECGTWRIDLKINADA